ncbi:MAG: cupredoxin domain-containing protein [Candidatus Omnitrophica bacterium]|nr:cupredoxin domain-containing protein [Candidatus Omnitrophota bacterium]
MSKRLVIVIAGIALIALVAVYSASQADRVHKPDHQHGDHETQVATSATSELSGQLQDGVRVVKVRAFKYGFDPDPIVVKVGEKVRLEVTSSDVRHGLGISDIDVNVLTLKGKTGVAEFIAEEAGEFHVHCSVYCGAGHGKMHGLLVVLER